MDAPARGPRALGAFRSRDFRLLWAGQTVSLVGDSAFLVALGWRTFTLTGKASSLGIVLLAETAAMVATLLLGGVLADRYERRKLMIASDVVRALAVGGLAAVDATGHLGLPALVLFAAAVGLGTGFFQPAVGGIVPLVVERDALASANSLIAVSRQGSFVVGPALAAPLYGTVGSSVVFAVDAVSFLLSAALLWPARPRRFERGAPEGALGELLAGIRYVAGVPWLWVTITLFSVIVMIGFAPFQVLLPKLVEEDYGRGVGGYGLLFSLQGVGMALGALAYAQAAPRRGQAFLMYGSFAINSAATVVFALAGSYVVAAALSVLRGLMIGFGITLWDTVLMQRVPDNRLARVISVDWFGSLGLLPVGYALAALVAGAAAPGTLIAVGSAVSALLCVGVLAVRPVRRGA